ncbi:MAG: M20/M25/M40 family metallo-hydrolase [Candidatus Aenigmarchaeota archaeon]|nr:M20/M25/M40 family metallo-hydrolase [Candidatus Aenigmarchaeota archaeon]
MERNLRKIDVAEKGVLHLKIIAHGKQAHASTPKEGVNAIQYMNHFLNLLETHEMRYKRHTLLSEPTLNLGYIHGGTVPNVVPAKCETKIDIRYLPSQTSEEIVIDVKRLCETIQKENKDVKFKVEIIQGLKPTEISPENELVEAIKKNARLVIGVEPEIIGMSGATVAKQLIQNNVIAVGYGPGDEVAHKANEYAPIDELVDFAKIAALVTLDLLG